MMALSGAIGLTAAWVTEDLGITFLGMDTITPAVALVIGYAGGDLIENVFKILMDKPTIHPVN